MCQDCRFQCTLPNNFPRALKLNATAAVKSMSLPHDSNVAVMSNDGIVHKLKRVGG